MYLNLIGLGLLGMFVAVLGYYFHFAEPLKTPERFGLLVAQDTGKTKHIQSKTGDASLSIQERRRRTIHYLGIKEKYKIRETRVKKGSTTGAIETFFISYPSCPCCVPPPDVWYDGGYVDDEYCVVLDGEDDGEHLDAGNQHTEVCPSCIPIPIHH